MGRQVARCPEQRCMQLEGPVSLGPGNQVWQMYRLPMHIQSQKDNSMIFPDAHQ